MSEPIYKELVLERAIESRFGIKLDIDQMIAHDMPINRMGHAQVFLTPQKQLYVYIEARSNLNVGEVKKIISRMGCIAEHLVPLKGREHYFEEVAFAKFKEVFPGRLNASDEDLMYYRTLVPYNPALIQIREIKDGNLYQFDADNTSNWRIHKKFSYRRLKTS